MEKPDRSKFPNQGAYDKAYDRWSESQPLIAKTTPSPDTTSSALNIAANRAASMASFHDIPDEISASIADAVRSTYVAPINAQSAAIDLAADALESLVDCIDVPDKNCSCHISPPCSDCVDNEGLREAVANAQAAIAKLRAADPAPAMFIPMNESLTDEQVDNLACILDAYESGIGHGLQGDGHKDGPYSLRTCKIAYGVGYDEGMERAALAKQAPAQTGTWADGVKAVADFILKKHDDHANDHAEQEQDTGAWVFSSVGAEDYSNTLSEIEEEVRALLASQPVAPANKLDAYLQSSQKLDAMTDNFYGQAAPTIMVEPVARAWAIAVHGEIADFYKTRLAAAIEIDRRNKTYPEETREMWGLGRVVPEPPRKPIHLHMARWAIDGAIAYGYQGVNKPPSVDHWLMEYWLIGEMLANAEAKKP